MLLTTKLFIPQLLEKHVTRLRLHVKLAGIFNARLAVVSAPAGFGKSTLLAEWFAALAQADAGVDCAWVSLDEQDNDPARFYIHLLTALNQVDPTLGGDLSTLQHAPQPPGGETLMAAIVNDAAKRSVPILLALDDYHVIENGDLHKAVTFLIDHIPPCFHLLIATRADPPFPLARWRVRRSLIELRERDLRFRRDEIAAFLVQAVGVALSEAEIDAIEQRTEGWIGALQLAALSLQGAADVTALLAKLNGSHAYIVGYLVEEVLNHQSPAVQRFLLQTSILDRMCGDLCRALTGEEEAEALLLDLHRQNLFTIPLDDQQLWFRYHHLFAEVLQARLRRSGANLHELYLRASRWSEDHGSLVEAVHYALAGGDSQRAAQLVEQHYWEVLKRTEFVQLQSWLRSLPAEQFARRPGLSLAAAWTLYPSYRIGELGAHLDNAERALSTHEQAAPGDAATVQRQHAEIATLRAGAAFIDGDLHATIERAQQTSAGAQGQQPLIFCVNAITLGASYYYLGQIELCYSWSKAGYDRATEAGLPYFAAEALNMLMLHLERIARFDEIEVISRRILGAAAEGDALANCLSMSAHYCRSKLLLEWWDLDDAGDHAEIALQMATRLGIHDMIVKTTIYLMFIRQAQGNWTEAHSHLLHLRALAQHSSRFVESWLAAFEARAWLIQGETETAGAVMCPAAIKRHDEVTAANDSEAAALVRLLYAQGKLDEALDLADRVRAVAAAIRHTRRVLGMLAFRALVLRQQGHGAGACTALQEALVLAEGNRFFHTFWSLPAPMDELLGAFLEANPHGGAQTEVARQMLHLRRPAGAFGPPAPPPVVVHPSPTVEPLSARELEVLALVAQGLSDRQVAERLIVAPGTVKRHLNNLYGKLAVHSRTQAVARAHALGLLPQP